MTTVVTIEKLPEAATEDVTISRFAAGELSSQGIIRTEQGKQVKLSANFTRDSGDPDHPLSLTINTHYNPDGLSGIGETSVTLRMEATQVTTVDDEEIAAHPVQCGIFYRTPGHGPANSEDLMALLSAVYGLMFTLSTSPDEPSTTVVESLANGNLDIVP
jgi:hypothetical protein